jgi:hypothetical protein
MTSRRNIWFRGREDVLLSRFSNFCARIVLGARLPILLVSRAESVRSAWRPVRPHTLCRCAAPHDGRRQAGGLNPSIFKCRRPKRNRSGSSASSVRHHRPTTGRPKSDGQCHTRHHHNICGPRRACAPRVPAQRPRHPDGRQPRRPRRGARVRLPRGRDDRGPPPPSPERRPLHWPREPPPTFAESSAPPAPDRLL